MSTAPAAPGGAAASVMTDFAAVVGPELPELAVVPGCCKVAGFAAAVVLGLAVLCEELCCPDVRDRVLVAVNVP